MSSIATSNDRASTLLSLVARLRSERAEWEAAIERWNEVSVVVGEGFVAYYGGLSIREDGGCYVPTRARPAIDGILNVLHLSRKGAEALVARLHGDYRVVHYRDVPSIRIAEIDERIADYEALIGSAAR